MSKRLRTFEVQKLHNTLLKSFLVNWDNVLLINKFLLAKNYGAPKTNAIVFFKKIEKNVVKKTPFFRVGDNFEDREQKKSKKSLIRGSSRMILEELLAKTQAVTRNSGHDYNFGTFSKKH